MTDTRRLGHAQRRRVGAPSNIYDNTMPPPSRGIGDQVRAPGRYGNQTVVDVMAGMQRPDGTNDGHGYVVQGGKRGRRSVHLSGDLRDVVSEELL